MKLQPGDKAPDFAVNDQHGNIVKLSSFKGKKLVLYFYPKDSTPGCTAEACNLRDNYDLLLRQGYEVLGISTDNEKSHQKFIQKEKLPFRLLADVDRKVHDAYGTWVEKSMYGRKYMGTARVTFIIDERGSIEEIIEKVDTKDHVSQILKDEPTAEAKPTKTSSGTNNVSTNKKTTAAKKAVTKKSSPVTSPKKKASTKKSATAKKVSPKKTTKR